MKVSWFSNRWNNSQTLENKHRALRVLLQANCHLLPPFLSPARLSDGLNKRGRCRNLKFRQTIDVCVKISGELIAVLGH